MNATGVATVLLNDGKRKELTEMQLYRMTHPLRLAKGSRPTGMLRRAP